MEPMLCECVVMGAFAPALINNPVEARPYPGAKPHFLIDDQLDDRDWLTSLVRATQAELPEPEPKKPKAAKAKR